MLKRDLCPVCLDNPVAVNYVRDGITHYRSRCSSCIRKTRKLRPVPAPWQRAGYKKKPNCEICSFKFKLPSQSNVYYIDGNLKNNAWVNLKTVCLNCQKEVYKLGVTWAPGPIEPDF